MQALQLILPGEQKQSGWRPLADTAHASTQVTARPIKGEGFEDMARSGTRSWGALVIGSLGNGLDLSCGGNGNGA